MNHLDANLDSLAIGFKLGKDDRLFMNIVRKKFVLHQKSQFTIGYINRLADR